MRRSEGFVNIPLNSSHPAIGCGSRFPEYLAPECCCGWSSDVDEANIPIHGPVGFIKLCTNKTDCLVARRGCFVASLSEEYQMSRTLANGEFIVAGFF